MRRLGNYWAAGLLVLALGFWGLSAYGGHWGFWGALGRLAGREADWRPVNFELLRPSAAGALACPEGACPLAPQARRSPVFSMPAATLAARLTARPGVSPLYVGPQDGPALHLRFRVGRGLFAPPAVVDARVDPIDADHSTLALYARPLLGGEEQSRALLTEWLDDLAASSAVSG